MSNGQVMRLSSDKERTEIENLKYWVEGKRDVAPAAYVRLHDEIVALEEKLRESQVMEECRIRERDAVNKILEREREKLRIATEALEWMNTYLPGSRELTRKVVTEALEKIKSR